MLPGILQQVQQNNGRREIMWNRSSIIRQKGESQNGGNKKTKHAKFSAKTNISYPLIRTRTSAYQGVRNVCFSENLACFVFLLPPFLDSLFCLITDKVREMGWIILLISYTFKKFWHTLGKVLEYVISFVTSFT